MKIYVNAGNGRSAAAVIRRKGAYFEGSAVTVSGEGKRRTQNVKRYWVNPEWTREFHSLHLQDWRDMHGSGEEDGLLLETVLEENISCTVVCTGCFPEKMQELASLVNRIFPRVMFLHIIKESAALKR